MKILVTFLMIISLCFSSEIKKINLNEAKQMKTNGKVEFLTLDQFKKKYPKSNFVKTKYFKSKNMKIDRSLKVEEPFYVEASFLQKLDGKPFSVFVRTFIKKYDKLSNKQIRDSFQIIKYYFSKIDGFDMRYYDININKGNIVKNGVLKKIYKAFKTRMTNMEVDTTLGETMFSKEQKNKSRIYERINKRLLNVDSSNSLDINHDSNAMHYNKDSNKIYTKNENK